MTTDDRVRTPRTLAIADHLWDALAAMANEMGSDREALVNQALYTFARLNGFLVAGDLRRLGAAPHERTPRPAPPLAVAPPPPEERPALRPVTSAERVAEVAQQIGAAVQRAPEPPRLEIEADDSQPTAHDLPGLSQLGLSPRIIGAGGGRAENSETTPAPIASKLLVLVAEGKEVDRVVKDRFLIGRGKHCDLIINSGKVSREHAAIVREGASWYIEDLGSSNGTWFDKRRISRRQIQDGDEYYICSEKLGCVFR